MVPWATSCASVSAAYFQAVLCTKINHKGSVAQDMESVNEKRLYIVFWIIENR